MARKVSLSGRVKKAAGSAKKAGSLAHKAGTKNSNKRLKKSGY